MITPSRFLDKDTVTELMADMARRPSELGPLYPSLVEKDPPVVRAIRNVALTEIGQAPNLIHLPNAFDQGYLNNLGIPTVNFGCGEYAFAHTHDDLASIDRTVTAARIFARLIEDVAGSFRSRHGTSG